MAGEHDEDALFERLAKSLEAVRQDAELARSGSVEGLSGGLVRIEGELRSVTAGVEALRQRFGQQHAVTARLEAAAAKNQSDLQGLRQTVEALSLQVREQVEARTRPSAGRAAGVVASVVIVLLLLVLAGGSAVWISSGRHPTVDELAHRFMARVSELTGINLPGRGAPARSAQTVAEQTPSPESAAQPHAAAAPMPPASAAPEPATPPATAAQTETPSAASPPGAETAAAAPAPVEPPAAAAPPPAQTPAAAAPPPVQTAVATPPVPVAPTPAAALPMSQSGTSAPAETALAQPARLPQPARQIVLRATADSWVEVRQKGGRVLLRRTMKAGETWPVPAEPDLLLDSGNAGALVLEVNGVPTKLPGVKPGVVRNVQLDSGVR
jgi:hypothetical protein